MAFHASIALAEAPVLNVKTYGATGSGATDDAPAIQSALTAAGQLSLQINQRVKVFLPAGQYAIKSAAPVIPSNVILSGDTAGVSTILNRLPPNWQPFVMGTRDFAAKWSYLAIARADDTSGHPAVPNDSYQGLNYVYLRNANDAASLRALGVPASVQAGYAGLPTELATGATLGNNGNTQQAPRGSDPKLQLEYDNGINPAPAVFARVLAADSAGKVTLSQANRFNWGVYAHKGGESLADYYQPSGDYANGTFISGPGWIIPASSYHHDIDIEHLTFEGDLSQTSLLPGIYGLYLGYSVNVAVRDCVFQKLPGYYPVLSIRAFNTLFERNQFKVAAFGAVTLDAGSGWTFDGNVFSAYPNPNAGDPGETAGARFFIGYDEAPIDITVTGNRFSDMPSLPNVGGQAVLGGTGGSYSRIAGNLFTKIGPPISESVFVNDQFVFDSNVFLNSPSPLMPGSGATGANAYDNRYLGQSGAAPGNGLDFYSSAAGPVTYFALNHGVFPQEFFYPNTVLASNTNFDGSPINFVNVINVNGVNGAYGTVAAFGKLSDVRIKSVAVSAPSIRIGQNDDVTVTLSGAADQPYPLYLLVSGGERDAVSLSSFLITIPAGQTMATLPAEVAGLKDGRVVISARALLTSTPSEASAIVTVR